MRDLMETNELAPEVRWILALRRTDQLVARGEPPHSALHQAAGQYEVGEEGLRALWTQKRAAAVAAREALLQDAEEEPEDERLDR